MPHFQSVGILECRKCDARLTPQWGPHSHLWLQWGHLGALSNMPGYVAINVTLILQGPPRAVWALPHTSPLVMLPLIEGGERLATPGPERGEMRSHIRLSAAWTPSVMSKYQRWTWGRQGQEPSWYASTSCVWSDYSCLLPQSRIHHRWTSSAAQVVGRHLQLRNQQSWEGELAWRSHTSLQAEGWAPQHCLRYSQQPKIYSVMVEHTNNSIALDWSRNTFYRPEYRGSGSSHQLISAAPCIFSQVMTLNAPRQKMFTCYSPTWGIVSEGSIEAGEEVDEQGAVEPCCTWIFLR